MTGGGGSRAKDGVQSVGVVGVPAAKLCLSQFQDHIRVTLGRKEEGNQSRLAREGGGMGAGRVWTHGGACVGVNILRSCITVTWACGRGHW